MLPSASTSQFSQSIHSNTTKNSMLRVPANANAESNKPTLSLQMSRKQKAKDKSKSVRFHQQVHVAPFDRPYMEEAKDIWYSRIERARMKAKGREMAATSYRLGNCVHPIHIDGDGDIGDSDGDGDSDSDVNCYRGFEHYTFRRQRQRLLSNRCAIYAHKQGLDATTTAAMYQQVNHWSSHVAHVQAIHDFFETHNDTMTINHQLQSMMNTIPSVASMIPPPALPFLGVVLQSPRKSRLERQRNLKRRSHTAINNALSPNTCQFLGKEYLDAIKFPNRNHTPGHTIFAPGSD